jgi:hypothetical protein
MDNFAFSPYSSPGTIAMIKSQMKFSGHVRGIGHKVSWENVKTNKQTNSVAFSTQANYTDRAAATCQQN